MWRFTVKNNNNSWPFKDVQSKDIEPYRPALSHNSNLHVMVFGLGMLHVSYNLQTLMNRILRYSYRFACFINADKSHKRQPVNQCALSGKTAEQITIIQSYHQS